MIKCIKCYAAPAGPGGYCSTCLQTDQLKEENEKNRRLSEEQERNRQRSSKKMENERREHDWEMQRRREREFERREYPSTNSDSNSNSNAQRFDHIISTSDFSAILFEAFNPLLLKYGLNFNEEQLYAEYSKFIKLHGLNPNDTNVLKNQLKNFARHIDKIYITPNNKDSLIIKLLKISVLLFLSFINSIIFFSTVLKNHLICTNSGDKITNLGFFLFTTLMLSLTFYTYKIYRTKKFIRSIIIHIGIFVFILLLLTFVSSKLSNNVC